jgi:hypothetical protein
MTSTTIPTMISTMTSPTGEFKSCSLQTVSLTNEGNLMKKKVAIAIVVLFIIYLFLMATAFAQTQSTGVKQGDVYSYSVQISSNDPSLANSNYLQVEAMRVNVTNVDSEDYEINFQNTMTFKDGTTTSSDGDEWIGSKYSPYVLWYLFYPAHLSAHDHIDGLFESALGVSWEEQCFVNETVMRTYAGVQRETNHLSIDLNGLGTGDVPRYNEHDDIYFDKQTGILVELNKQATQVATPDIHTTFALKMTDSNVWTVPEFPSLLILSVLLIVILFIAILYKKQINKPRMTGSSINCCNPQKAVVGKVLK